jgi:hypothetical protein
MPTLFQRCSSAAVFWLRGDAGIAYIGELCRESPGLGPGPSPDTPLGNNPRLEQLEKIARTDVNSLELESVIDREFSSFRVAAFLLPIHRPYRLAFSHPPAHAAAGIAPSSNQHTALLAAHLCGLISLRINTPRHLSNLLATAAGPGHYVHTRSTR